MPKKRLRGRVCAVCCGKLVIKLKKKKKKNGAKKGPYNGRTLSQRENCDGDWGGKGLREGGKMPGKYEKKGNPMLGGEKGKGGGWRGQGVSK